ncbi:hypothetical protein LTR67_006955 [Exophiala xenobiotica]
MSPENIQAIIQMEDQADNLVKQRDNEVKAIWSGYTERWGPATVGIHYEGNVVRGRRRAQSASDSVRFPEVETSSSLTSNNVNNGVHCFDTYNANQSYQSHYIVGQHTSENERVPTNKQKFFNWTTRTIFGRHSIYQCPIDCGWSLEGWQDDG